MPARSPGAVPSTECHLPIHPLIVRLAFCGHRTIEQKSLAKPLADAFALVAEAAGKVASQPVRKDDEQTISGAHAAIWPGSAPQVGLDLLVGHAPGADREAAVLWRAQGYGSLHAVFPFADLDAPDRFAWTDRPNQTHRSLRVLLPKRDDPDPLFHAVTILDGEAALAEEPPRDAHLEQSRWLTRWADLLVVAWNGRLAAGTGGTADTVALALAKGLPVIWIDTHVGAMDAADAEMPIRLLSPERLWLDGQFSELVDALGHPAHRAALAPEASAEALAELLIPVFLPPSSAAELEGDDGSDEETSRRREYATGDPLLPPPWSGWRGAAVYAFCNLRRILAVWLAERWTQFYRSHAPKSEALTAIPPPKLADSRGAGRNRHAGHPLIDAAFAESDKRATLFGNLHRAIQSLLLIIAVLAVFLGTLPAVVPGVKTWAVCLEFVVLIVAWFFWHVSFFATSHRRWSDTRRLAERLRALRATWPLDFDVNDDRSDPSLTWTEWQARAVRRAAGPPTGFLSAARLSEAVLAACDDRMGIVAGQTYYNATTRDRMMALHHRVQWIEQKSFYFLLTILPVFLIWHFSLGASQSLNAFDWKAQVGGIILMLSAVIPAIAAACLAIEAKLDIEENARRSARFAVQFAGLENALQSAKSPGDAQELLRDSARLLLADADNWRDAALRRRIATI
jgi:hypothetical protein